MGVAQSRGKAPIPASVLQTVFKYPDGVDVSQCGQFAPDALSGHSILRAEDPDLKTVQTWLRDGFPDPAVSRAVGCLLGCAIGDSLGAPLEFSPVRYGTTELKGFDQPEIWNNPGLNKFDLKPGQWTDDASMALCLAESLLANGKLEPLDLRLRFLNWWSLGYCNAFGSDTKRDARTSVGLGGNISSSIAETAKSSAQHPCPEMTATGDRKTSGNGSLMRLAPCPIFFAGDVDAAMDAAYRQSKTTHQGDEAAECCRLMTRVIVEAIKSGDGKEAVQRATESFSSPLYSVSCLAKSEREARNSENDGLDLEDRVWNWKDPEHRYAPSRAQQQPGYVGSYAMDALCMALHCVWTTSSFEEAVLKAANMRGDADTVADIAGQIAGAVYGASAIPPAWIDAVQQWDNGGEIAARAYKLYEHRPL